jgi:hypothetical protein
MKEAFRKTSKDRGMLIIKIWSWNTSTNLIHDNGKKDEL